MRSKNLLKAVLVAAFVVASFACGGNGPTAPSPSPVPSPTPTPTVVYAPPPAGVSPEVWRVGFAGDGKLYRPDSVHLVLPGDIAPDAKANFVAVVAAINGMGLETPVDFTPNGTGATFQVSVVPNLVCAGQLAGGCMTSYADNSGRITGGKVEFAFASFMHVYSLVMHETLRTLGLTGVTSSGVMALQPTQDNPTPEELAMLRGRYNYPLLSVYSAQ